MKTVIVSLSPRKSFSASLYYSKVIKFFVLKGDVSIINLKTQKQYLELEQKLNSIDNLVIVTPVYVDTIPSTALERLLQIENFVKGKNIRLNIYAVTNCGFYEGEQNRLAQKTIELWAQKCGFIYKGGLGIGAGVMIAFTRILPLIGLLIEALILSFRMFLCLVDGSFTAAHIFYHYFPYTLVFQTGLYLLWNMGFFINGFKLAKKIEKSKDVPLRYITIWFCPRYLFVVMASIYWFFASMIWYRGKFWRLHKEPKL
ncbi:MAG: hypothetical protein VB082_00640 [Christensenella sp.]|nr:hypothetical protein [Christensenella sp.]